MRALLLAATLVAPTLVTGQTAAPSPPPSQPPGDTYSYQPGGRPDPFRSLLGTGDEPPPAGRRADGPAGLIVSEISVRGVMQSRGSLVAMVQGPDRKTYLVHAGDKFLDGVVKDVTLQGLVILQDVNDPLTLVKQREVHKLLRSLENAKE